jgi:HEAT repeat protein
VVQALRQDEDPKVRTEAAISIFTIEDFDGTGQTALEYAAQNDEDSKVRNSAKNILQRIRINP